jgi:hypothetical protein
MPHPGNRRRGAEPRRAGLAQPDATGKAGAARDQRRPQLTQGGRIGRAAVARSQSPPVDSTTWPPIISWLPPRILRRSTGRAADVATTAGSASRSASVAVAYLLGRAVRHPRPRPSDCRVRSASHRAPRLRRKTLLDASPGGRRQPPAIRIGLKGESLPASARDRAAGPHPTSRRQWLSVPPMAVAPRGAGGHRPRPATGSPRTGMADHQVRSCQQVGTSERSPRNRHDPPLPHAPGPPGRRAGTVAGEDERRTWTGRAAATRYAWPFCSCSRAGVMTT